MNTIAERSSIDLPLEEEYAVSDINETHEPGLRSWVGSANRPGNDFPIQNLPFGVFRRKGTTEAFRGGVAIGDQVLDLAAVHHARVFDGEVARALAACCQPALNAYMSLEPSVHSAVRRALSRALRQGAREEKRLAGCLVPQEQCEYAVPATIGDYTDFYTSIHHATAIGRLFRPDNPLLPNYKWVPIGYHGRSSTIAVSGQVFRRPMGQVVSGESREPRLVPTGKLDYELELGIFIGKGTAPGAAVSIDDAEAHVFGICLLNDWSARDIQAWEYQPLGPFLSKNFATTISPWIVTLEALAPFRAPWSRPPADPAPLAYLWSERLPGNGAIDIRLEVSIQTERMRTDAQSAEVLASTSYRHAYWTMAQMVTHHTVNGCMLRAGDLLGTGTLSGPTSGEEGALIELTRGGKKPVRLGNGQERTFLDDGDAVIMRGWCEREGFARIGFGEVVGRVQGNP